MRVRKKRIKKLLIFFIKILFTSNVFAEAYSELCETTKMENFAKIVNGLKSLIVFHKKTSSWMFDRIRNVLLHYKHIF